MRARRKSHFWKDGWVLSLVSVLLLAVSGWLGQQLVYVHGVGVRHGRRARAEHPMVPRGRPSIHRWQGRQMHTLMVCRGSG